jgi:hypothetical protein
MIETIFLPPLQVDDSFGRVFFGSICVSFSPMIHSNSLHSVAFSCSLMLDNNAMISEEKVGGRLNDPKASAAGSVSEDNSLRDVLRDIDSGEINELAVVAEGEERTTWFVWILVMCSTISGLLFGA